MNNIKLECVFIAGSMDRLKIWDQIEQLLTPVSEIELYDKPIQINKLRNQIKKLKGDFFNIKADQYSIRFAAVPNSSLSFLQVKVKESKEPGWWQDWINIFSSYSGFLQGWLSDIDYEYWQNASDPVQYQAHGKPIDGLALVSNGLPHPMQKNVVDTSKNLGLRKLCNGYIEAIGAQMWLSTDMLRILSIDEEAVHECPIEVSEYSAKVLWLSSKYTVFKEGLDEQLEESIRNWLFNRYRAQV
tara:strand:- start:1231 stop:1959 length:729 start_codon:yes stop_codon:yes gene_type:complete